MGMQKSIQKANHLCVDSVTINISKFYQLNDDGNYFHGESVLFTPRFDHKAKCNSGW